MASNPINNNSYQHEDTASSFNMGERNQSRRTEVTPDATHEMLYNTHMNPVMSAALAINNLSEQPKPTTTTKWLSSAMDYGTPTRKPACSLLL